MSLRLSVAKPAPGAGSPKGKEANATLVYVNDLVKEMFPNANENGVKLVGNIVLKAGARMQRIYMTDSTQKASHKYEGDPDAGGFMKQYEGSHPGDELEINEFVQNSIEEPFIIIYDVDCNSNMRKVVGLPCNPLYLEPEFMDDDAGVKHTLIFKQRRRDRHVSKFYEGELSFVQNNLVADVTFLQLSSPSRVYQLPEVTVADTAVTIVGLSADDKKIITLIGGGGSEPATLIAEDLGVIAGQGWDVTILLSNNVTWTAEKGAFINLQVYDAGAKVYLIEISRG
jgi:hypothetical protein